MKKTIWLGVILIQIITLSACKTEYEKVRQSGDPNKMLSKANEYYEEGDYTKAVALYELLLPAYRGRRKAEELHYKFADAHFKNRSFILSSHYFKNYADTYTGSDKREDAMFMHAYSEYLQSPRYKLDQMSTQKAIEAFQLFINNYPLSERVGQANIYMDELRGKLEIKAFEAAKLYYRMGNYNSALQSFDNMLIDFPESQKAEEAYYLMAKASVEWAENSIYTRQQERYEKTIERCNIFLKKFPQSSYNDDIEKYKNQSIKELNNL